MTERTVRMVNDPSSIGVTTGQVRVSGDRRFLQVRFSSGSRWVPEEQLDFLSEELSPIDQLRAGTLGSADDLRRTLTHVKLSGRLSDVIYSMEATNTEFYAYQFKPVLKILQSPSNSILIADEVGLGKTIEAGLIWTELRARFDLNRLVVLCPAALREKWRFELSSKLGIAATLCDASEILGHLREISPAAGYAVVASLQGLRPPRDWEDSSSSNRANLARFLRSMESSEHLVDLLIVDEAHHLRNPKTRTHELGSLFRNVSDYCIFLSATPIHNKNADLDSLLTLLDGGTFSRPDVLEHVIRANEPLVRARDLTLTPAASAEEIREQIETARRHPLLVGNRQLEIVDREYLSGQPLDRAARSRLAHRLEAINLLAHVVSRTRKRDVTEWKVIREPVAHKVTMSSIEKRFYELVSEVVRQYASERDINDRFLLCQPQRQMTSSMAAALRAWQDTQIDIDDTDDAHPDDEDGYSAMEIDTAKLGPLKRTIVARSRDFASAELLKAEDTKYASLRQVLRDYLGARSREKIVLFSYFRPTLRYLEERLTDDGISCVVLMGGQREPKQEIIDRFRESDGPSVLLSSEVGGEGIDLQFSRIVINYDLPWNPMVVEQRIGRVDRLGQTADTVFIWNMFYSRTVDDFVYAKLYDKLDLCRKALGDLEVILGESIHWMTVDLLTAELTPQQQEARVEQAALALENRRTEEYRLEESAATLVAYGEYILNEVHAARELNRWVTARDLQRYVLDYLQRHYPGCDFKSVPGDELSLEMRLSDAARTDLTEYVREKRLAVRSPLCTAAQSDVLCRFDTRAGAPRRGRAEVISQLHPLVRMIRERQSRSGEQHAPAAAVIVGAKRAAAPAGLYLIAVQMWEFRSLQDVEKLAYAGVHLEDEQLPLESEAVERLVGAAIETGKHWLDWRGATDPVSLAQLANDVLFPSLLEAFTREEAELVAQNEDRADVQLRALEEHLRTQEGKLLSVLVEHQRQGRGGLEKATEGRIRALQERARQQKARINAKRTVDGNSRDVAIVLLGVQQERNLSTTLRHASFEFTEQPRDSAPGRSIG